MATEELTCIILAVGNTIRVEETEHDYCKIIPTTEDFCTSPVILEDIQDSGKKDEKVDEFHILSSSKNYTSSSSAETSKSREFAKCDSCRKSRTKVLMPNSLLNITTSKNDGMTCDFCGDIMDSKNLMIVEEGKRHKPISQSDKKRNYVVCSICEKVVLKESLSKHIQDIHEKSNKMKCEICSKILAGPFSLKEHITAIHDKIMKHQCSHCLKQFSHFSNMNRHIRLIHEKLVVKNKYVNCPTCQKCVQATSLKKHIRTIHEGQKDHKCKFCGKGFTQSFTLKEHIASKHTKTHEHKCEGCDKTFAHRTNYMRHLKSVHSNKSSDEEDLEENQLQTQELNQINIKVVGLGSKKNSRRKIT